MELQRGCKSSLLRRLLVVDEPHEVVVADLAVLIIPGEGETILRLGRHIKLFYVGCCHRFTSDRTPQVNSYIIVISSKNSENKVSLDCHSRVERKPFNFRIVL